MHLHLTESSHNGFSPYICCAVQFYVTEEGLQFDEESDKRSSVHKGVIGGKLSYVTCNVNIVIIMCISTQAGDCMNLKQKMDERDPLSFPLLQWYVTHLDLYS